MYPTSVVALFCEDIREEVGGTMSLIGLLPDDVNTALPKEDGLPTRVGADTKILGKLCAYIRVNFDPAREFREGRIRMIFPDERIQDFGALDINVMKQACEKAKAKGNPMAGIITRVVLGGFNLPKPGLLRLEVKIDDETYLAGAVNFRVGEKPERAPNVDSSTRPKLNS